MAARFNVKEVRYSSHEQRHMLGLVYVYPAIITVVALSVVTGLLMHVVPQVVGLFEHTRHAGPHRAVGIVEVESQE